MGDENDGRGEHEGGDEQQPAQSLLPYDEWTEEALRHVARRAIRHAAGEGLPGDHHFYITFRTDDPGVVLPERLRAQYPREMTIVLQHQFWDLKVDDDSQSFSVGLSFGGIPSTLQIPFAALTGFADPAVRYGLRFRTTPDSADAASAEPAAAPAPETADPPRVAETTPQVVSLDAFRRRQPAKDPS